jgi:hypothetical protein
LSDHSNGNSCAFGALDVIRARAKANTYLEYAASNKIFGPIEGQARFEEGSTATFATSTYGVAMSDEQIDCPARSIEIRKQHNHTISSN